MKIKKSFLLFFIMPIIIFTSSILKSESFNLYAADKNTHQTNNTQAITQDIDKVLFQETTPSAFCMRSLRSYFNNHSPQFFDKALQLEKPKTNTALFQNSFLRFIGEEYNQSNYANKLSQDASHIIELLEIGDEMDLSVDHVYVCLRLFYNKLKAAEIIDDTVVTQLLNSVPPLLVKHFHSEEAESPKMDLSFIKRNYENLLLSRFTDHHIQFKKSPDIFLADLAHELSTLFQQEQEKITKKIENHEYRERLRQIIIRFFETTLSKTIWNPNSHESIWSSFISIGNGLRSLATNNIINHLDDLDDLFRSLTLRFCYNVDLYGGALPLQFFDEVDDDLNHGVVLFLEADEQDAGIKSKKDELREHLLQAKTKALAYVKSGIISQPM